MDITKEEYLQAKGIVALFEEKEAKSFGNLETKISGEFINIPINRSNRKKPDTDNDPIDSTPDKGE